MVGFSRANRRFVNQLISLLMLLTMALSPVTMASSGDRLEKPNSVRIVVAHIQPIDKDSESVAIEFMSELFRALGESEAVELMTLIELTPHFTGEYPPAYVLKGKVGWSDGSYKAWFELFDASTNVCPVAGYAESNSLDGIASSVAEQAFVAASTHRGGPAEAERKKCRFGLADTPQAAMPEFAVPSQP